MKSKILILAVAMALTACSRQPQQVQYIPQQPAQVIQSAPAPVVVQQAAPAHSGGDMLTGALLGGMAGHMIGSSGRNSAPQVVHKTVIVSKTVVNRSTFRSAPSYKSRSSFGSFSKKRR